MIIWKKFKIYTKFRFGIFVFQTPTFRAVRSQPVPGETTRAVIGTDLLGNVEMSGIEAQKDAKSLKKKMMIVLIQWIQALILTPQKVCGVF